MKLPDWPGVSLATASRVLNGSSRKPAEDIAERVREAADKLGYVPNAQAQALAKSSSGLIGLIVHDIADPYFSAIARGVQEAARQQNRMVLLASTSGAAQDEKEAVAAFAARRADSIVIAGSRSVRAEDKQGNIELAAELDATAAMADMWGVVGHPVVGASTTEGYHVVEVPPMRSSQPALLWNWPLRMVVNSSSLRVPKLYTSDDRVRGFQRGLADAGRPAAEIIRTGFNRAGGYDAGPALAERIKASEKRLCIFAVNDVMAIGVTAALRPEGVWIPRDATIAGFDDIETSATSALPCPRCTCRWRTSAAWQRATLTPRRSAAR